MAEYNITIVAHRGKGPTKSFTDPGNLWSKYQKAGLLVDPFNDHAISNKTKPSVVPEKIMIKHNKLLISDVIPPENTLAAFERAIVEGTEIIELDVFISQDGIPVVIHNNALNTTVSGAKRGAKKEESGYLGTVKDYTAQELQLLNMGYGNKIPTLQEVVDLLYIHNTMRDKESKAHLKLNIEFKDKDSVVPVLNVIQDNIKSAKISNHDIIYCSFYHDRLKQAVTLDKNANVALALYTKFLYGKKNVNAKAGWTVDLDKMVSNSAIHKLQNKIKEFHIITNNQNNSSVAVDTVLWDIDHKLIKFLKQEGLDLYASTSNFRDFANIDFARNLLKMSKHVRVFFKTDEPGKVKEILSKLSSNPSNLDSSSVVTDSTEKGDFISQDDYKYLQRLPKPNQKVLFIEESTPNDLFRIIDQPFFTLYNHNRDKIAAINLDTLTVTIYDKNQFFCFLNKEGNNYQKFINKFQKNFFEIIEIGNSKSYLKKAKISFKKLNSLEIKPIIKKSVKSFIKQDIALWKKCTKNELKVIDKNINSITLLHKKELMSIIKKHIFSNSNLQNQSIDNNTLNCITKKICGKLYQSTENGLEINRIYTKGLKQKFKGYISDQLKKQGLIVDKDIKIKNTRKAFKLIVDNDLNINIKSLIYHNKKHAMHLYIKPLKIKIDKLINQNDVAEKAINKLHKIYDNEKTKKVLKVLEEQGNTKAIADLDLLKQNIQSNKHLLDQHYNILKKLQNSKDYIQLAQKYRDVQNTQKFIKTSLEQLEKKVITHYTAVFTTIDKDTDDQVIESVANNMEIIDQVVQLDNEGDKNYQHTENQNDSIIRHVECVCLGVLPQEVVC